MYSATHRRAFSLVELSIVLVILGLLVGGVLAGQSLIRAAELRSVTTEYTRYLTAVQTFRDKYFALPGDMANATAFWGAAHATPATCVTTASTSVLTCNGDGDGAVFPSTGSNEYFRIWQHLANAGLIEGSYSGITQGSNNYSATSANSPKSRLNTGLWFAANWSPKSGDSNLFDGIYGNFFELGAVAANAEPYLALAKPEEMWNLDVKLDDGLPAQGTLVSRTYTGCTSASVSTTLNATYNLTNTSPVCAFVFRRLF